jgi:hypothetical protein
MAHYEMALNQDRLAKKPDVSFSIACALGAGK